MKTLVTGGAGFIGSHVVDRLVARGDAVTVLDDLSTGSLSNLAQHADAGSVRIVHGTILDEPQVDHLIEDSNRVFHLAAAVGVAHILADPLGSLLTNSRGTENVLAACSRHGRKVVVASSSEVYGKTDRVPMREDDDRLLGSTTVPRWSYSTAKALDEHLALAYAARGLKTAIVRYFNIYGPRMDPRGHASVMANFVRQAIGGEALTVYGDGTQTRCFTYIDDCVEGTLLAMDAALAEGHVINIGNEATETSIAGLARLIVEAAGSESRVEFESYESHFGPAFEDARRRVPSTDRAAELLGWTATVGLVDGLRRTLDRWSARRA